MRTGEPAESLQRAPVEERPVTTTLRTLACSLAAAAAILATPYLATAADEKSATERIDKSIAVLNELVSVPENGIPQHILDRAEAIVVIPTLVKGGFVIGAEHGRGVMSIRDRAAGKWSLPAFVAMTGGSVGWQIGVQSTDLVLLVMNRDGVDDLLKSEFKIGADAAVAAGPVGRTAQAATDASMGAKILAYSRAKGFFAGLSLQGTSVREDRDANRDLYGQQQASSAVLAMTLDTPPAAAKRWQDALARMVPPAQAR